jgi:hypothetical protein
MSSDGVARRLRRAGAAGFDRAAPRRSARRSIAGIRVCPPTSHGRRGPRRRRVSTDRGRASRHGQVRSMCRARSAVNGARPSARATAKAARSARSHQIPLGFRRCPDMPAFRHGQHRRSVHLDLGEPPAGPGRLDPRPAHGSGSRFAPLAAGLAGSTEDSVVRTKSEVHVDRRSGGGGQGHVSRDRHEPMPVRGRVGPSLTTKEGRAMGVGGSLVSGWPRGRRAGQETVVSRRQSVGPWRIVLDHAIGLG